jgi:hypothetical protein
MATEEELRDLKKRHAATLLEHPAVAAVGIEKDEKGELALTVHLTGAADDLPRELDGHRVRYVRRGPYTKQ